MKQGKLPERLFREYACLPHLNDLFESIERNTKPNTV